MLLMVLQQTLRWLVIGSIFALTIIPFIIAQSLYFPFITGKNFTFRILVEVGAAGWLALALIYPAYRPRRSWILGAFAVFVAIVALADAFGAYPFKSFWSNYERMDGFVTLAHLFVYFALATSMLTSEKLWRAFWNVSIIMSLAIAFYSFLQLFGVASLNAGFSSVERLDATFGNPIYLAVYMLFHIFIAALLWIGYWRESKPGKRWLLSSFYGAVISIDSLVLLLTGTRGTMIGLVGGIFVAATLIALFERDRSIKKWATGIVVGTLVLAGGFYFLRDSAFVHSIGFLNRLATISLTDATTKSRFMNWGMAWEGVKERPILGWGQENYAVVFDKYYNPGMYNAEPWFDRVHNIVFDWLIAAGFLGLIAYFSIFAAALYALWRAVLQGAHIEEKAPNVRRKEADVSAFSVMEASILTGLLAGYMIHNMTVFDNIVSYILFASVVVYIAWRESAFRATPVLWSRSLPQSAIAFVAGGAALVVWGVASYVNGAALAQNRLLIQAITPQEAGLEKNLEYMKGAIAENSVGTQEAREQLVQIASKVASLSEVNIAVKQDFYDTAVAQIQQQGEASPLDARAPLFLGVVHSAYGNHEAAAKAFAHALELSPKKQGILYEIARNANQRGDVVGALRALKQAFELETSNIQARILYAAALISVGNDAEADTLLAPIIETGEAADPRIAAAYVAKKRYDKIVLIWEAYVKAQPNDPQGYFTLAGAYYGSGDRAKAISSLETAAKLFPESAPQVAAFIEQIGDGTLKVE